MRRSVLQSLDDHDDGGDDDYYVLTIYNAPKIKIERRMI